MIELSRLIFKKCGISVVRVKTVAMGGVDATIAGEACGRCRVDYKYSKATSKATDKSVRPTRDSVNYESE